MWGRQTSIQIPVAAGLLVAAVGCGGGEAASSAPKTAATAPTPTPGEKCLAAAGADRKPEASSPDKIEVMHILVRHTQAKVESDIERSREQACLRALEALEKLQGGADWSEVATEYSDEKGVDRTSGSVGRISYDDVDPQFGNAAFALDVNELSYVVETASGFHVIVRTE